MWLFDILDCPPDDVDREKMTKVIATNFVAAVTTAPETSAHFNDYIVDIAPQNILIMKTQDLLLNISYAVDTAFD